MQQYETLWEPYRSASFINLTIHYLLWSHHIHRHFQHLFKNFSLIIAVLNVFKLCPENFVCDAAMRHSRSIPLCLWITFTKDKTIKCTHRKHFPSNISFTKLFLQIIWMRWRMPGDYFHFPYWNKSVTKLRPIPPVLSWYRNVLD